MANPFSPTFGSSPMILAGRDATIGELEAGLDDGPAAPARTALFTGARGMGKTVMLNEFQDLAQQRGWLVIAEGASHGLLDRLTQHHLPQLLREHARTSTRFRISHVGLPVVGGGVTGSVEDRYPVSSTLRSQIETLTDILREHQTGLLLTIDEIQGAERDALVQLGEIIQHARREDRDLAFGAAGLSWAVDTLLNDDVLTFLRRAERFNLDNLSLGVAAQVLQQTAEQQGRRFTSDALAAAAAATEGYPFMIQLIGHRSWMHTHTDTITLAAVKTAIGESRRRMGTQIHAPAMKDLSAQDKSYLLAMAIDDGPSRTKQIADRLGVSAQHAGVYRSRLISHGLIETAGWGHVTFTLPYLRDYLRDTSQLEALTTHITNQPGTPPPEPPPSP